MVASDQRSSAQITQIVLKVSQIAQKTQIFFMNTNLTNRTKVQLDGPKGKVNNYTQLKRFVRFDRFVFKNIIRKITSN